MIEIAAMRPEDLPEVSALEQEIFSRPWSKDGFEASLRAKNTIYLTARLDGGLAGYCGMIYCMDEAEITNVAVRECCRRKGVASAMLRELIERGNSRGVESFLLEVRKSNAPAIALYTALGFTECGIRKKFYEKPVEDAVIMWKR